MAKDARGCLSECPGKRAAGGDQQKAFHKKKTEQRAAACAEGKAQAEFTLAGCIAGHEQHDDVGERDEQHKANHGHEDAQRLAIFLIGAGEVRGVGKVQDRRLFALHGRTESDVGGRLKDGLQLCRSLRPGDAGSQASHDAQAPPGGVCNVSLAVLKGIAPGVQCGNVLQGNPEIG